MDLEKQKKRQSLKVIISEAIMVLTVIATVTVLAFIVSGYWINSDFKVERQGMIQISSLPTGADVNIDGEDSSWLQRTNTSKVLPSGEHTIILSKEGYDTWTKTVDVKEGLLYRLHYPRLFLTDREKTTILDAIGTTKVFVSEDADTMLLYSGAVESLDLNSLESPTTEEKASAEHLDEVIKEWTLLDLTANEPTAKPVDYRMLYDFFKKPEEKKPPKDQLKKFGLEVNFPATAELMFSKFFDDEYLTVLDDATVTIYKKGEQKPIFNSELTFTPEKHYAGHDGEFVIFYTGTQLATLDMESLTITEWVVDGTEFDWLDGDMIYSVKDGELFVYDYDSLNRRSLAKNVSNRFPVVITNNRWMYYFSNDNLVRELIAR